MNNNQVHEGKCDGCRHWDNASLVANPTWEDDKYEEHVTPGVWGVCGGIIHRTYGDMSKPWDAIAYLSDGSGYFASLTTRSDFGCSLWEAERG